MKPIFYLSHSHADDYSLVRKFFLDLCDAIQVKLRSTVGRTVGFVDGDANWNNDAINAVETCTALVALLSPSYVSSRKAGQEWQTIESRRQRQLPHLQYQTMRGYASEGAIVPIVWIPSAKPLPSNIKDEIDYGKFTYSAPPEGLYATLKSRGSFGPVYTKFVNELAAHLIQLSEAIPLPPSSVSPTQVAPAFAGDTVTPVVKESEPYRVWILENHKGVREMLEEDFLLSGYSVQVFEEAESVEEEIYSNVSKPKMPDLFIVDLVLNEDRMQGLDFIRKMTVKPSPTPPIIAISGHLPRDVLGQAIGAGAWATFAKPIDMLALRKKVTKFSSIGRNKRTFSLGQFDINRLQRPVFLSYEKQDRQLAASLRNQMEAEDIGVWYAPETIPPGNKWRPEVRKGIEEAKVFIALLTNNYPDSGPCMAELHRFYERVNTESEPPLLLPVVHGLSEKAGNNRTISELVRDHHYIDMSVEEDFLDGLTALLGRLRRVVFREG